MKKGVIIINAYSLAEVALKQANAIQEELNKLGVKTDILRNDCFPAIIDGGKVSTTLNEYDFCVYLDKDKHISAMLERSGLRLFNRHNAIVLCDDKMLTSIALSDLGIPLPRTIPAPLCYSPDVAVKEVMLQKLETELGYPMVVKETFGSLGKGVYLVYNRTELYALAEKLKLKPHLYQQFIKSSYGKDVRVMVIGGRVVASMLRQSKDDFRSNIGLGGTGYKFVIDNDTEAKSILIARALGLDYCGIDYLLGENGETIVCEVNSNAYFDCLSTVSGVNIAAEYAKHIVKEI